jgi:hypothetical protein
MMALESSAFRLFPLSPIYNFRRFTFTSLYNVPGPARPVVVKLPVVDKYPDSMRPNHDYVSELTSASITFYVESVIEAFKKQV